MCFNACSLELDRLVQTPAAPLRWDFGLWDLTPGTSVSPPVKWPQEDSFVQGLPDQGFYPRACPAGSAVSHRVLHPCKCPNTVRHKQCVFISTEVRFPQRKVNRFQVRNSAASNAFTARCNRNQDLAPKRSQLPKGKARPSPLSPPPAPDSRRGAFCSRGSVSLCISCERS